MRAGADLARNPTRLPQVDWDYHMPLLQAGTPGQDPAAGSIIHFHHFRQAARACVPGGPPRPGPGAPLPYPLLMSHSLTNSLTINESFPHHSLTINESFPHHSLTANLWPCKGTQTGGAAWDACQLTQPLQPPPAAYPVPRGLPPVHPHTPTPRFWRAHGIAYELRDSQYTEPNRSLFTMAIGRTKEFKDRWAVGAGLLRIRRVNWGGDKQDGGARSGRRSCGCATALTTPACSSAFGNAAGTGGSCPLSQLMVPAYWLLWW